MTHKKSLRARLGAVVAAAATAACVATAVVPAAPAEAEPELTITFVRHAESAGNASGLVDTKTPGPALTELGRTQARQVAVLLEDRKFDGVFASRMIRTQQTAAPLARKLFKHPVVLPGIHEILAGDYEGTPERDAPTGYMLAPQQWLRGDLAARIPGAESGTEFKARFTDSIAAVVKARKTNAVVFSHGATIMFGTILASTNGREYMARLGTDYMKNVGRVVLKGNPTDGWRITEWVGNPTLPNVPDCISTGSMMIDPSTLAPC
ncbi:Broad specificity phosphatase PhoE [Gordonia malaquae]|jgi:broad specificity phosphatase PhoE|uniref:Phosphoglycerate mutase family protein n=1 Tax=Gordonia malaquae NBRC 108250 TaxID=1223542 RepID=M3UVA2_GORML|nr:histidine phosphatase family protein [Gordonia malaquae]GAC79447.1 phosphoglycerate mutase family protein [Gordonia malaquae NBRC 108250]SED26016.1 Broad specificity phosphatase PhoE [Gordonia malaquae]